MPISKDRLEDLRHLEHFVKELKVSGSVSNLWYHSLRAAYPFEFIYLAKKYNKSDSGQKRLVQEAINLLNKNYARLKHYLTDPPETEEEKKEFDKVVNTLEGLLLKQNSAN